MQTNINIKKDGRVVVEFQNLLVRIPNNSFVFQINTFAGRYEYIFTAGEIAAIAGIRENIDASVIWSQANYNIVNDWLSVQYNENGTNAITSSFLIIISLFVTIYNYQ